ncbi:MAG: hypothetical protein ACTSVB_06735 [Candidatus Heimdallarchaeaceae archaeon]
MSKDQVKSLVNSVAVLKEMVENIVKVVQKRFEEFEQEITALKKELQEIRSGDKVESSTYDYSGLENKLNKLETRLEKLNEKFLLSIAAKTVEKRETEVIPKTPAPEPKPTPQVTTPTPEAKPTPQVTAPPPEPKPTPQVTAPPPEPKPTPQVTAPTPEVKPTPQVTAPTPEVKPTPQVTAPPPEPKPTPQVTAPTPEAKPTPQVTAPATKPVPSSERDVSPIAKEAPSAPIPSPPKVAQPTTPQPFSPSRIDTVAKSLEKQETPNTAEEPASGDKAELLKALKKLEEL